MRRCILTLFAFSFTIISFAQATKKTTSKNDKWKQGGRFFLVGGQGGSRNWAAGAEKFSFSFAANLNLYANKTVGKHTWDNNIEISYGLINTHSGGIKKNDDKLDFYSKYGYKVKNKTALGFVGNLRTQLYNSYNYDETPQKRIGGFFAPAYLTFAPGADFKICPDFTVFLSPVSSRWVIATNRPYSFNNQGGVKPDGTTERSLAELYGVNPERKVRYEFGAFVSAAFKKNIAKNVEYQTRLDVSGDYSGVFYNMDVFWTNNIRMKVNNWLMANYNFDLIQDDDVKMFGPAKNVAAVQMKSMLGVGLSAKF